MDRLDLVHALFVKALGQKLFLSPLDESKVHRALDLGTGTGICTACHDTSLAILMTAG